MWTLVFGILGFYYTTRELVILRMIKLFEYGMLKQL